MSKLSEILEREGYSIQTIADYLGIGVEECGTKVENPDTFLPEEISALASLLGLSIEGIDEVFFGAEELEAD